MVEGLSSLQGGRAMAISGTRLGLRLHEWLNCCTGLTRWTCLFWGDGRTLFQPNYRELLYF